MFPKDEPVIPTPPKRRNVLSGIVLCILICVGVLRIVSTYHTFSQTADEPAHVATGMEWLERGTYTFETLHPPLARVAVALGLYLSGVRLTGKRGTYAEGNELLFEHGRYMHNLALARLGALPFFILAAFLVWHWSRERYGDGAAVLALVLFTTCPVVLGHAGVAATDMALAATFTGALWAFIRFLEQPTYKKSATLGLAMGAAVLSKFSALLFLPACGAAVLACRWWLLRRGGKRRSTAGRHPWRGPVAVAAVATCLVVWAGYRFSLGGAVSRTSRPYTAIDRLVGSEGALHNLAYSVAESRWVPAPAFFQGISKLRDKNSSGHKAYLFGQIRQTGWWYFFPVALAVKTPVPFLILIAIGIFYLVKSAWAKSDWVIAVPAVSACVLILVCLPSQINIGVRHLLPIYPLFAVIGGAAAHWLWNRAAPKYMGARVLLALLLVWQITASARIHPDYLAYFNEFAGEHPERILTDSDLDWGQDLLRLSTVLRERHIEDVSIAYGGSAGLDLSRFGLPRFRILEPHQHASGWIAISLLRLKEGGLGFPDDSFAWLEAYQPVSLVGRSIRLYYVR